MNKTFVTIVFVTMIIVTIAMNFVTIANAEDKKPPMTQADAEWLMRMNNEDFNSIMWKASQYLKSGKTLDHCMMGFPSYWWKVECHEFGYKYWDYKTKIEKLTK